MTCPRESSGISLSRSASIASAQAAAMSLASPAKLSLRSDCDINITAAFDDFVFLQPMPLVYYVRSVLQVKLPSVPGTHDVHIIFVKVLAKMDAFVADLFDDLGKFQTLAGRSALMGADVAVREILTLVEYDADLNGSHLYQSRAAIRNLACLA